MPVIPALLRERERERKKWGLVEGLLVTRICP
jgi:hypothetical protein